MAGLYPEPPHLTIAVYPKRSEGECFAAVCELMGKFDCRPTGTVEVAPWDMAFELRSDLAGRSAVVDLNRKEFQHVVAGGDAARRPIRAGYSRGRGGLVVVEYLAAPQGDRHPVAVSTAAGALGIPVDLWRKPERSSAQKLARWTVDVLRAIATRCDALYGGIGVEYSLATPSELASGTATLSSEVYLSRDLVAEVPEIPEGVVLDLEDGEVAEWPSGWFFPGWGPFRSENTTLAPDRTFPARMSRLLGSAIVRGHVT